MLYIWVVVFAALYFRPFLAILYLGGVGVAFAVVLMLNPSIANPVTTWLLIIGSAAILSTVTISLVSVLRSRSVNDPLTGLANRRAWDERLDEEMERTRRSNAALSMAMIDIDQFKVVNDRDGHHAGDQLLCQFADGWREVIRGGGDFLARLGGDEFGVLSPSTSELGIQRLAKRLHEIMPGGVSCSIGVVTWDGTETAGELVRRADEAMYRAKRARRAA
ncbi:MAG TPA: GGDEF domain-containing protein [Acidimicrobiales bacterium]|nr:GGDEF domain-containing protein [Acidimicrobiales bacterium]